MKIENKMMVMRRASILHVVVIVCVYEMITMAFPVENNRESFLRCIEQIDLRYIVVVMEGIVFIQISLTVLLYIRP